MKRDNTARSIWKSYYGEIPIDELGRTYEIHHIDGNCMNNDISNLVALSIEEHYKIHYDKGEYGAANLIAKRINDGRSLCKNWKHSDDTKDKIRNAHKNKKRNRIWITNGLTNRVIKSDESIPEGWKKGRVLEDRVVEKIKKTLIGKKQSEQTKQKRSESLKGHKKTEEHKQKLADSWTEERRLKTAEFISNNRIGENHPNFGKPAWNRGKPAWNKKNK